VLPDPELLLLEPEDPEPLLDPDDPELPPEKASVAASPELDGLLLLEQLPDSAAQIATSGMPTCRRIDLMRGILRYRQRTGPRAGDSSESNADATAKNRSNNLLASPRRMELMMHPNRREHVSTSRTDRSRHTAAVFVLAAAAAACAEPSARTPADQAAFMERTRCASDDDDKTIAPVLNGSALQRIEPLYGTIGGAKSGPMPELRGVTVIVVALPGVTAEWLDRALECHSAKEVLGHEPAPSDDPFWLPGSAVNIDVTSDRDGFNVSIIGYSANDAQLILARATSFAKGKAAAAPKAGEGGH
jgi:hypothetical protein